MAKQDDKKKTVRDPIARSIIAQADGHKEWVDSYEPLYWGVEPLVWVIIAIGAVTVPTLSYFLFGFWIFLGVGIVDLITLSALVYIIWHHHKTK